MPNKKNILSQNAPLIFQWLPKRFGASVPNNSEYPYLQRIVNWAEKEPDRNVYLILNGAGLEKNQFRSLKEQLIPIRNIKVIDFNTVELCDDFSLQIGELEHLKISELLKYDKNLITDERLKYFIGKIPFAVILDTMRLAILKNIEKITSVKEAIYMDFDILPNENQESIKIINISKNILMADGLQNEKDISGPIENSIIAINEFSEPILSEMINEIQTMFSHYARPDFQMSDGAVFGRMKEVITDHVHSELFGIPIEKLRSMRQKDFWDYQKIIKKMMKNIELITMPYGNHMSFKKMEGT